MSVGGPDAFSHHHAPGVAAADDRAGLIATQILGPAFCRYIVRLPQMAGLKAETIVATVGPVIQRYLTAPLPGGAS
jgi:hypothetical protein